MIVTITAKDIEAATRASKSKFNILGRYYHTPVSVAVSRQLKLPLVHITNSLYSVNSRTYLFKETGLLASGLYYTWVRKQTVSPCEIEFVPYR